MKPLCVFYHCICSGGETGVNTDFAISIIAEQMHALKESGLLAAATEFHVGVNGDDADAMVAGSLAGDKAKVTCHGKQARSEIPTMNLIRNWLPGHEDWYVLYHHTKSVTHPSDQPHAVWRRRMQRVCVENWRLCVEALDAGFDAAGAHWLTPEKFPSMVKSPFFGGNFFFATARFLSTLPPFPAATWANRFFAENWIGSGPRRPKVRDFCPGWP